MPGGDVIYHWQPDRSAERLQRIVAKDFTGTLQCDGYAAYPSFIKQRDGPIEQAACWDFASYLRKL
ncbi:MAG: transposase [Verrucomicrobiota bacterium JB024]|nr:transposase [Verrucomicrobiota bacterium JB024]